MFIDTVPVNFPRPESKDWVTRVFASSCLATQADMRQLMIHRYRCKSPGRQALPARGIVGGGGGQEWGMVSK